jgi:guanyl-specific ribonuclease Sa
VLDGGEHDATINRLGCGWLDPTRTDMWSYAENQYVSSISVAKRWLR